MNGLTEAQQALRRKFPQLEADDPILEMAAWNATLEQQLNQFGGSIDVWTTAILKQAEASSQQGQLFITLQSTLNEIAQNNARLTSILQQLSPKIDSLLQDSQIHRLSIAAQADNFNHLSRAMAQINAQLHSLDTLEERLTRRISASSDETWRRWMTILLAVILAGFLGLGGLSFWQVRQANHFNRLLNSVLIRLERIERAFGIQP